MEYIQYTFDDLEMLKNTGIKVVIIETPFPFQFEKETRTQIFKKNLKQVQKEHIFDDRSVIYLILKIAITPLFIIVP